MTARIKTQADCDSFLAAKSAASTDKAKAPAGGVIPSPASSDAAATATLPKDCVDAGLKLKTDCDALHFANGQKGKSNAPAGSQQATSPKTPASPAAPTDAKVAKSPRTPAPAGGAPGDLAAQLAGAAKSFNVAATMLSNAGQDKAATVKARGDLQTAQAKIDELCKLNKSASTSECLRQYKITLIQVEAAPAASGNTTAMAAAPAQPVETIKTLPKGVTQDQVAPLLDSAKETKLGKGSAGQAAPAGAAATVNAAATPPPKDDKAAQADIKVATVAPIDQAKGQPIVTPAGGQPPAPQQQVQVPKNVTIVNQTTINNSTTNTVNTTNFQNNSTTSGGADKAGSRIPDVRNNGQAPAGDTTGGRPNNPIGLSFGLVLQLGNETFVNSPARDQYRIANRDRDHTDYERLPQNRYRETITRPDGVRVVTIYDQNGDILRRSRFDRDGHEVILAYFDDSHDRELLQWRDPGDDLPPLRLNIPASDYVLDAHQADARQVEQFFGEPPVERVERLYSISEVKRSARIRDMVRRLEIGDLTFATGSAALSPDQFGALQNVAEAMLQLLQQNPAETFLIEGHTDAVGSDASNLVLSDARAATVAGILSDNFQVPPENLATQGYGAHYLKVQTDGPEQLNRRVVVRRITPLVTVEASNR
ncbi:MAG TPA: OmpA family protein [Steroidobacteraceae bacterium]